jgi:hypothetical protein
MTSIIEPVPRSTVTPILNNLPQQDCVIFNSEVKQTMSVYFVTINYKFYNKLLCGLISIYSPVTGLPTLNMWHSLRDFRIPLRSR